MPKCFLSAIVMWSSWSAGGVPIAVSVESADGEPLTNLSKNDFSVGFIGSSGGPAWIEQKVSAVDSSGSQHGFYTLSIANFTIGTYSLDWQIHYADSIFTVEVTRPRAKGAARGRTLAINTPTTPV